MRIPNTGIVFALFMAICCAEAFGQNSIQLEQLLRELNARQQQRGNPLYGMGSSCASCNDQYFPEDGAFDDSVENDPECLADAVNDLRDFIWDINNADSQSDGIFYEYIDSDNLTSFNDPDDLIPTSGEIPSAPADVDGQQSLAQVQADAQNMIGSILSSFANRDTLLGTNSGVNEFSSAAVVSTGGVVQSRCYDNHEGDYNSQTVCERLSYALSTLNTSTGSGGGSSISASSTGSNSTYDCMTNILGSSVSVNKSWSSGYIEVSSAPSFAGQFLVYARLYNSQGGISLVGPSGIPGDGDFHLVGTLGSQGGQVSLSTPIPLDPTCSGNNIFSQTGWSIRTGTLGEDNSDIVVLAVPAGDAGPDLGGCSPDLSGIGSADQPEVGSTDDGPVMAPGCEDDSDANPDSEYPIAYSTGHKHETAVDLRVAVPGQDWVLKRDYTSDPEALSSSTGNLLGNGWSADPFCHLVFDDSGSNTVVTLVGAPQNSKTIFVRDFDLNTVADNNPAARWHTGGPSSQTLRRGVYKPDNSYDDEIAVWILEEPGEWYQIFYRQRFGTGAHSYQYDTTTGSIEGDAALYGYPLLWTDVYGNNRFYQYWSEDVVGGNARLRNIYLNGTPNFNIADAVIQLDWELSGSPSSIQGMLDKIVVLRPTETTGEFVTTQFVDYTYGAEQSVHTDVGDDTDLVMVKQGVLMDATEGGASTPYYSRYTQYRYHDNQIVIDDDERFEATGLGHQLKAIIEPEQIEYVAQQRTLADISVDAEEAVGDTAQWLLSIGDDGSLGTWDTSLVLLDTCSKIIGYESGSMSDHRVLTEFIQTACNCGGSGTQGQKIQYDYISGYTWASSNDGRSVKEAMYNWDDVNDSWALHRTTYTDLEYLDGVPYTKYKVIEEPTSEGGRQWITEYEYDSAHNLSVQSLPSWFDSTSYTAASGSASPSLSGTQSNGLRYQFEYTADNRLTKTYVWDENLADFSLQRETLFGLTSQPWLVTETRLYREAHTASGQSSADELESIEFEYEIYSSGDHYYGSVYSNSFTLLGAGKAVAAIATHVEAESSVENGPGSTYTSYTMLNYRGQPEWTAREDGSMVYRQFDPHTGLVTALVDNANRYSPAAGEGLAFNTANYDNLNLFDTEAAAWGLEDPGTGVLEPIASGELITRTMYDQIGRPIQTETPGGSKYATTHELRETESRPGALYAATVSFPHDMGTSATPNRFDGPVTVGWINAGGETIETAQFTLDESESFDPLAETGPDYTLESNPSGFDQGQLAKSVVDHSLSGLVEAEHVWHDVDLDASYTTEYGYDSLGRRTYMLDSVGTGTHYEYDSMDRVIATSLESSLGVQPGGEDLSTAQLIREQFYDADQSLSTPAQGVGNGLVTVEVAHTGEGSETRTTNRFYDNRDRLVGVVNEELPTSSVSYDNLDRVIETAVHSSLDSGGLPRSTSDSTDRGRHETASYSQRGLVYLTEQAVDPAQQYSDTLRSDQWFDSRGRVIASRTPSVPMTKTVYDAHSRVVTEYTTDHGDTIPGSGSYADASSIGDDRVIEQVDYMYDDQNRLLHTTQSLRPHTDTTSTDALTSSNAVRMHTAFIFDAADRVVATANYGTGVDDAFEAGLSDPSFPTDPEDITELDNTGALVTKTEYNRRGIVSANVDAEGMRVETLYDDLARPVATIENATNVDASDVTWYSNVSEPLDDRWEVTYTSLAYQSPEEDRVTSFVYNGDSNIVKRVAHFPKQSGGSNTVEGVQITEYLYGTDAGSDTNTQDSLVASGSLLFAVQYPAENDGLPIRYDDQDPTDSDYLKYSVQYAYNRLGEPRGQRDQNLTELVFERDGLGRVVSSVADVIDTDNTGDSYTTSTDDDNFIDDSILRIETEYDSFGRVLHSTSREGESGASTIANQVEFSYTPLWQVKEIWQEHDGAVDSSTPTTPKVEYVWDTSSSSNYTRLQNLTYPSQDAGTDPTVEIDYGVSGSIDDRISREVKRLVETLGDNGSTHDPIVSYEYLGLGTAARVTYDAATGIELSRVHDAEGNEDTSGGYPGFDRFGRVRQQLWVDSAFGPHATSSTVPAIPPIVQKSYSYDLVHNRLTDQDARPGAKLANRNFSFEYDSLHRLVTAERSDYQATLSGKTTHWELDAFGNWAKEYNDTDTDGSYSVNDDRLSNWSHNQANELTQGIFSLPTTPLPTYSFPNLFQHDDAGNMRRSDRSTDDSDIFYEYIYDAWNRLVKVIDHRSSTVEHTILENEYNGLGWRISRLSDTSDSSHDGLDESRSYFYSADWQLLEEHVDTDLDDTPDRIGQQFWGARHLNDAVAKRINWDPSTNGPDYTDGIFFYLTDALYSPLAIVRDDGDLVNRVFFGTYGFAEHSWASDVDQNGVANFFDYSTISSSYGPIDNSTGNYNVDADFNRDGDVDDDDVTGSYLEQMNALSLPSGWIDTPDVGFAGTSSRPLADNSIGFAGAVFDPAIGMYQMRSRYYAPEWGRFIHRDPMGYIDGQSMYEYVRSNPATLIDPLGLSSVDDAVGAYAIGKENIMLSLQEGRISPDRAKCLMRDHAARYDQLFDQLEFEELLEHARDVAGSKAVVNAASDTLFGLITLGFGEAPDWLKYDVDEYDMLVGYGAAYMFTRIPNEFAVGVLTGKISGIGKYGKYVMLWDMAGNATGVGRGMWSMSQSGVGWANSVEVAGGLFGLSGNGFSRGLRPSAATNTVEIVSAGDFSFRKPRGIPSSWGDGIPSKRGGGVRFVDPTNSGHSVRIMPGNSHSQFPNSRYPYVRWHRHGSSLDKYGNIVGKHTSEAHIPLSEFKFNPEVYD